MGKAKKARLSAASSNGSQDLSKKANDIPTSKASKGKEKAVENGNQKAGKMSSNHLSSRNIAGFIAAPLSLSASFLAKSERAYHWLYFRAHQSTGSGSSKGSGSAGPSSQNAESSLPSDRTLFIANVPVDTTERHLRALFQRAGVPGQVQRVEFQGLKHGDHHSTSLEEQLEAARRIAMGEADDDDLVSSDDENEAEELANQASLQAQQRQKKLKKSKKDAKQSKIQGKEDPFAEVPEGKALPTLNPRIAAGAQAFLPTSTSVHVVFVDASSLTAALEAAESGAITKVGWTDPYKELAEASATAAAVDEQDKEAGTQELINGKRKRPNGPDSRRTAADALLSTGTKVPPMGLAYLLEAHRLARPTLEAVRAYSDSTIARYEYLRSHPDVKAKLDDAQAVLEGGKRPSSNAMTTAGGIKGVSIGADGELLDEDGFVIVRRGGKYGRANAGAGQGVGVIRKNARSSRVGSGAGVTSTGDRLGEDAGGKKKKHKGIELEDFYKFQRRDKKRDELAELRAQFEKDKERVKKLKESRRFKP